MAEAFYQIANSTNTYGEVLNVGTGTEVSMREVLKTVLEEAGRPVEVVQDPERMRPSKSEVMRLLADNNKVKELVGWEPKVPFNEGIRKTIEWFKNNKVNNHNLNMYHR
jgi:nucleoside-diphosphate-sugar epimerase